MTDTQWREEDGVYKAEVNGWGVTVEPHAETPALPFGWCFIVRAKCGCCGKLNGRGFALAATLSGAQSEGISMAQGRRPPEGFVPAYHGEKA